MCSENTIYYLEKIASLEKENDKLKDMLLDATMELNFSKEKELLLMVRNLKVEIYKEIKENNSTTKEEHLNNIKIYINNFAKEHNIMV
jgi:hypothetical protein